MHLIVHLVKFCVYVCVVISYNHSSIRSNKTLSCLSLFLLLSFFCCCVLLIVHLVEFCVYVSVVIFYNHSSIIYLVVSDKSFTTYLFLVQLCVILAIGEIII